MPPDNHQITNQTSIEQPNRIEALLLSGGESRRMGENKTLLTVNGEPMGVRIAHLLTKAGYPVTVLGEFPNDDEFTVLPDTVPHSGPLTALSEYTPHAEFVFVSACDIPLFDPRIVKTLFSKIIQKDAAIPTIHHHAQPLCALYKAATFSLAKKLVQQGEKRIQTWIGEINAAKVSIEEIIADGLDSRCVLGVNTPEELEKLLNDQ